MANESALQALKKGLSSWQDFCRNHTGELDLTYSDLRDSDLKGYKFVDCNFSASRMQNANLDNCEFNRCNFTSAQLKNCSLVDVIMQQCNFRLGNFSDSVIKDASFTNSTFEKTKFNSATVEDTKFNKCKFSESIFDTSKWKRVSFLGGVIRDINATNVGFHDCYYEKCSVNMFNFDDSEVIQGYFSHCHIKKIKMTDGIFSNSKLNDCEIETFTSKNTKMLGNDFGRSTIYTTHIFQLNPANASFLDTAFVDCEWPKSAGKLTFFGKHVPSQHLLLQPVQDVKGLPPNIRRDIADSQFLRNKLALTTSPVQRFFLSLWGLTTGYGQSVLRLFTFCVLFILLSALILLISRNQLFGLNMPDLGLYRNAFGEASLYFLGLGETKHSQMSSSTDIIIIGIRAFGFIALGLWVSIASAQLTKLSSS